MLLTASRRTVASTSARVVHTPDDCSVSPVLSSRWRSTYRPNSNCSHSDKNIYGQCGTQD